MVKIFTKNKNNKIELSEKELKEILDEAYWDGYHAHGTTYIYNSPNRNWWDPYIYTTTTTGSITLTNNTTTGTETTTTNNLNSTNITLT